MEIPGYPCLARLLDRDEAWALLGDFDALMKVADQRIASADGASDAVEAAKLVHGFARDHYHLLLVGEFKVKEIGRGIQTALDTGNETALFNLARAFVEHTAALAYQIAALEKAVDDFPRKADMKGLREAVARHRRVTEKLYYNRRAAIHVHDMIKALAKHHEPARREYEALCEFVHPNFGSNKLVSSGELGAGQIRARGEELGPELARANEIIERCATLADDEFSKTATYCLIQLGSWIEIACQDGVKLGHVFSLRSAMSGDGMTKETAIFFTKARTHQEAMEAFYDYLGNQKLEMLHRKTAAVGDGFLYDEVTTAKGTLWVKYKLPQ